MLIEQPGDLFVDCPPHISLGHAVSLDFSMHAGLARMFRAKFGQIDFLRSQVTTTGMCSLLQHEGRYVFYLVTKARFYHKPTYISVTQAFQSLRYHLLRLGLKQVAIPGRMCCRLDRLNWRSVKQILTTVFQNSGVEIHIFYID